jgi:hypothetical protein
MKHIITIFKNLGTIVILSFQIVYVSIIDYMSLFDKTSTKNKTATSHTKTLKKRDVCWNSEEWKDEVVHERPYYK